MTEKTNPFDLQFGRQVLPAIKNRSEELSGLKTALDIGCSNGANSRYLASLGLAVDAIDTKLPKNIGDCKNVSFKQMDILDFPFDKKYDVIIAINVLHFLSPEDRNTVMSKMYKALNKDGYLFIRGLTMKDQMVAKGKFEEDELFTWGVPKIKFLEFFEGEKPDINHDGSPGTHIHHITVLAGEKINGE